MTRPAVLVVEPDEARRRKLSQGLASEGYEAVPAASGEEGILFARGLGPAVIVAPSTLARFGDASILSELTEPGAAMERTLVLLGDGSEDETNLPGEVVCLNTQGLGDGELIRRLRLVLIGREIGVAADSRLEALVGDLAQKPLLELVRILHVALLSGQIEFETGAIHFVRGSVFAAEAGPVSGLKAFCRLGRLHEGPFRILLDLNRRLPEGDRQIHQGLNALINAAIRDTLGQYPDPKSRLQLVAEPADAATSPLHLEVLDAARRGLTLREVLDTLGQTDGETVRALMELEELGAVKRLEVSAMVRIIADSAADLSLEQVRRHGLTMIPIRVFFGQETYHDRVDLKPRDFYSLLEQRSDHPMTRPATPEDVQEVYRYGAERSDVVALHVSSKASETFALGCRTRDALLPQLKGGHGIEVVDSGQISMGLGLLTLFAARMAARGLSAKAIAQRIEGMRSRVVSLAMVTTLDYLVRGGRVGKVQAFLGDLLGIRPLLGVDKGEVITVDKVRRRRKAVQVMLRELLRRLDTERPIIVAIAHANSPVDADRLRQTVASSFDIGELMLSEIGPGIGTHMGPGAFLISAFQPEGEEVELTAPLQ